MEEAQRWWISAVTIEITSGCYHSLMLHDSIIPVLPWNFFLSSLYKFLVICVFLVSPFTFSVWCPLNLFWLHCSVLYIYSYHFIFHAKCSLLYPFSLCFHLYMISPSQSIVNCKHLQNFFRFHSSCFSGLVPSLPVCKFITTTVSSSWIRPLYLFWLKCNS